jgi:hypothetical protein
LYALLFLLFDQKDEIGQEKSQRANCAPDHDLHLEVHFVANRQILKKFVLNKYRFSKQ